MAKAIKARFGVYTTYNQGGKRLVGKKPEDVKYVKMIQRS